MIVLLFQDGTVQAETLGEWTIVGRYVGTDMIIDTMIVMTEI